MPDFTDNLKPAHDGTQILEAERNGSPLSVQELSKHLLSRNDFLNRQARILEIVEKEPLMSKKNLLNLARPDRYHLGLARAKLIRRLALKHDWNKEDADMAEYLVDEMSPYHLHLSMFVTTVREQGSEEQKAHWMPQILNYDIIGCYAQTELGHGSNVRGLECQAKYDPTTKEFIIHSPTLTASKWWNGTMGRTATHAIIVAQLMLPDSTGNYVSHGPHPFVVQIRNKETHLPLDGIVVGDIGPKYGYTSMDNGYMLLDNHRVPHSAMLARYSHVDPNTGAFSRTGHQAVVYGSLTNVRATIIMHARLILARAVTIAVRYSTIRRQFHDRDDSKQAGPEMTVLDYPTVQIRILPLVATTFALHYTGEAMFNMYTSTRSNIEKGDFSGLAELHGVSSGLKSLCTTIAANGIETCRRALGGHGFGGGSGLININNDYLSKPTVEGDNWMITQQTARYLIKKMESVVAKPDAPAKDGTDALFKQYLKTRNTYKPKELVINGQYIDKAMMEAFEWRAADLTYRAYEARVVQKKGWTSLLVQLHRLSNAYSESFLVSNFHRALVHSSLSQAAQRVMRDMYRLFALSTMDADARTFQSCNAASSGSLDQLPDTIQQLMLQIRPHAVKVVDAWSIPDYVLDSALGRYDGKVYEDLYDRAHRQNPLNRVTFNVDWRSDEIVKGSNDGGKDILAKL
ncbi:acyl-CoA oxidase [Eremomyces bilateralis CBS 781.70]|uniref:Acyl-coenzyme A oxidase n=1 Tax=Eremomyces bilateralis CBS 781.70 TaxID=1392243 RepID=A0A6G1FUM7_9PEZI|nr:acyl-CoA oxidase [Eremomyces bilateralis CBS 781.70]KAF1809369.1 acyl-CoA oxidase [Eremomyces bilateralis CBS 781.70]